ncbi:ABC transporter substrate-binding protein [Candidatus Acetothermia bacterium]|nr:MAG: ABC transporter substrate-binding protein [Candidatus Acetothermia bacterium]RLE32916.1 MAG: ABC transporter substrate-binding protein [Candidatus Acetothermia bacterium]HDC92275.1 ABC transporter substrate-binding protein [Candidatus Acetothermia bacterium]
MKRMWLLVGIGILVLGVGSLGADDVLVMGVTAEPETLDPHVTVDNNSWRAIYYCYDRLVEYEGGTTKLRPGLAESWEISDDGLTYTFHLRKGITFIDGTPFNAEAVKFNFERLFAIGKGPAGTFEFIKSVEVVDEYTVKFTLHAPFAPALSAFATDQGCIVSPGVMEHEVNGDWGQDWLAEHTAGTGPFYAAEWIHGMRLVLKRNDNYWGEPAKLAQVELRYVPEPEDLRMLLEKGEIDIAEKLTVDQIKSLKGVPGIRVFEGPSFSCHYIYLNCQRPYLNDVRVRRAISYAIDYEGIVDYIWQGTAVRMEGPVPIGFAEHIPVYQYPYDPDRARALLKEAGYEKGFTLRLMHSPVVPEWRQMAIVVQQNLADIGIKVQIESYAWATLRAKLDKGDFDMSFGYWTPDYADADMFTWFWFYSENWGLPGNRAWYKNEVMDDLVTAQRVETDPEKRQRLFEGIQWLAVSDAPYVYLVQTKYQLPMREWVKGYVYNPMLLNMPNFPDIYIER